jgi:ribulose-phosphate 3-epimerase
VPWSDWIRTVEIEPSLYAANFGSLAEQVEILLRTGARIFHWDVGDGHFVEPITMGPIVLKGVAPLVHELGGVVDVHLMTEHPERQFAAFAAAGADSVTVHYEAVADVGGAVRAAREQELQVGVALKPATPVEEVAAAAAAAGADFVLCMSVEPGYSGQQFIPESVPRLARLRELLPPTMHLQVDGGVNDGNARAAREAGADLLVAATAVFGNGDPADAYRALVAAAG